MTHCSRLRILSWAEGNICYVCIYYYSAASFQTFAGLPPTGEIDKRTWKNLALYYTLTADQLENLGDL